MVQAPSPIKKRSTDIPSSSDIQEGLEEIYTNGDGTLPDISHLEFARKSSWQSAALIGVIVLVIVAIIGWLAIVFFGGRFGGAAQSLKLTITGPQNIASGSDVQYVVTYKNVENVALHNIEIAIRYPDGFTITTAEPAPTSDFTWTIGRLERAASGQIIIHGRIIGEVGSLKTINATAVYRPENFSSDFKETASYASQITSSILSITVDGPAQTITQKRVSYTITYHNTSDEDLHNVKIIVTYPTSFVYQEAVPQPTTSQTDQRTLNNQWLLPTIEKNQTSAIVISGGYLDTTAQGEAQFGAQVGFYDATADTFSLQQEAVARTEIIGQALALTMIINGSNQDQSANPEQELTYSIVYKNLGKQDLNDVVITAELDPVALDWSSLNDSAHGVVKSGTIQWSKNQLPQLGRLGPLEEGTLQFSLKLKSADALTKGQNLTVSSKAHGVVGTIGSVAADTTTVDSNEIITTINTDIELQVQGRYFDSDNVPVGSGPLPPVVGQQTTIRIYWSLANSAHDVSGIQVKTILPTGVEWAGKSLASVGGLTYDQATHAVSWNISHITPNKTFADINTWFDIAVTPTKQQVKKLLILTNQATLTGTDSVTQAPISKVGKTITSNLEDDPIGGGKGLVVDFSE